MYMLCPLSGRIVYPYLYEGFVVDNEDPEKLGRLRIHIPGLIEPASDWCFPTGTIGGGGRQRGGVVVPEVGSMVDVVFVLGDLQRPKWQPSHWGVRRDSGSEMPEDVRDATSEPHKIQALQVGKFRFVVDERDDKLVFRIEGKDGTDVGVSAELDLKTKQVTLSSTVAIILKTAGLIDIDGLIVRVKNRLVAPKSAPI